VRLVAFLCWVLWTATVHASSTSEVGKSRQGRPIVLHSLGSGPRNVLVLGGVHGDELPSVPLVTKFKAHLENHPELLDGLTVHIILEVNPDGVAAKTRTNSAGVDINRNMEFEWSPESRGPRTFPGLSPYSEPETVALKSVIETLKPDRILSVHAYADILDYDTYCGLFLAQEMSRLNSMKVATIGYPTPGSLGRYCSRFLIPLVTLELPRGKIDDEIWEWQRPAMIRFLQVPL
jgi:murein peptide amidase A